MFREALLIRTLAQLADSLVDDFDVVEVLTTLSDRCVEVLDVDAAGVLVATRIDELRLVASSSHATRVLELLELQAREGPGLDCYRSGEPIVNRTLVASDPDWPTFAPQALDAAYRTVSAIPLRLRGHTVGVLNLLRTDAGLLVEADVIAARALADVATIAIVQHQVTLDAEVLMAQLTEAFASRVIIEEAKGMLAEAAGVDIDQAFRQLRRHARNHSVRLADLSRDIAEGTVDLSSLDPLYLPKTSR
jgi:GAF domain-containing protein